MLTRVAEEASRRGESVMASGRRPPGEGTPDRRRPQRTIDLTATEIAQGPVEPVASVPPDAARVEPPPTQAAEPTHQARASEPPVQPTEPPRMAPVETPAAAAEPPPRK